MQFSKLKLASTIQYCKVYQENSCNLVDFWKTRKTQTQKRFIYTSETVCLSSFKCYLNNNLNHRVRYSVPHQPLPTSMSKASTQQHINWSKLLNHTNSILQRNLLPQHKTDWFCITTSAFISHAGNIECLTGWYQTTGSWPTFYRLLRFHHLNGHSHNANKFKLWSETRNL